VPSKPGVPIVSKTPIFKYLFILALLVWFLFGIYIIAPAEKGVILRFGAFQPRLTLVVFGCFRHPKGFACC
jgi:membrane protease subunit HflK